MEEQLFMSAQVGQIYEGKVTGITKFGAFVEFDEKLTGMVHISEVTNGFLEKIEDELEVGQAVTVKVINISPEGKIGLSIKQAIKKEPTKEELSEFEMMMKKFKQRSEEKISELNRSNNRKHGYTKRSSKK